MQKVQHNMIIALKSCLDNFEPLDLREVHECPIFLGSALPLYTTMLVSGWVGADYTQKSLLSKPLLRLGWRQFLQY